MCLTLVLMFSDCATMRHIKDRCLRPSIDALQTRCVNIWDSDCYQDNLEVDCDIVRF